MLMLTFQSEWGSVAGQGERGMERCCPVSVGSPRVRCESFEQGRRWLLRSSGAFNGPSGCPGVAASSRDEQRQAARPVG